MTMATPHYQEHGHHIAPTKVLLNNLYLLMGLMVVTVLAAKIHELVPSFPTIGTHFANAIAIAIALIKAFFVVSIFMGVKYTTNLAKLFAIGGFVWFLLMFGILIDYWSRPWEPVRGWESEPSTSLPRTPGIDE
jgi:caa(3)-type oxidase subunit IV